MNSKQILVILAVAMTAPFAPLSNAAMVSFSSVLDCAQAATSGAGCSGSGQGTMELDTDTGDFSYMVTFSGLSGDPQNAHFHGPAAVGQPAGVALAMDTSTLDAGSSAGNAILDAGQMADLLNGLWYVNIHTSTFGGGEIRGQVNPVPLPAAVWLFASVLGAGAVARRLRG